MTTPAERTRSIRWAHELLQVLAHVSDLPPALRDSVTDLVACYPSPEVLQPLISSGETLPAPMEQALCGMASFLEQPGPLLANSTFREPLRRIRRHYPTPADVRLWNSRKKIIPWEFLAAEDEWDRRHLTVLGLR